MSIRRSNIRNMPHDDSAASSQSLERGLAILGTFTPDRPALGISELAQRLGLTRSTTHRYVATLAKLGYPRPGRDHPQVPARHPRARPGIRRARLARAARDRRAAPAAAHRSHRAHLEPGHPRRHRRDPDRPDPRQARPVPPPRVQPARRLADTVLLQRDGQGPARVPAAGRPGRPARPDRAHPRAARAP